MSRPKYLPTIDEINSIKEAIFRENVARGEIRLGSDMERTSRRRCSVRQCRLMIPERRMTRSFRSGS